MADETDPERVQELLSLLRAVIKDDPEEVRVRLLYIAEKYASVLKDEETREAFEELRKKHPPLPKCG